MNGCNQQKCPHQLPRQCMSDTTAVRLADVQSPCWPVSGLTELVSSPSQARVQNAQWLVMKAECVLKREPQEAAFVRFTVAGAAQVKNRGA